MNLRRVAGELFRDRVSRLILVVSLVLNLASWYGAAKYFPHDQPLNPLHYTIYFGINLTGRWTTALWLPAIGAAAMLSHFILSAMIDHLVWRRLWMLLALLINILLALALVAVINLIRLNVS